MKETLSPEQIYDRSFSIDTMCFGAKPPINYEPFLTQPKIEALRTSGITALSMCMTVPSVKSEFEGVLATIKSWDDMIEQNEDLFVKIWKYADVEKAKSEGKVGLIFNFQNTTPFGMRLERLNTFVQAGVRQIQLSHDYRNFVVDGCRELTNAGVSRYGYKVIEALNEQKVIVDVTHLGDQSALDTILHSKAPVIFSHSGCYSLCPHPRNVSDRNIRLLADNGGVFHVYNQSAWITSDPDITMDHYLAHVEHVIQLAGEDHVGMGTDGDAVDMSAMRPDEVERHQALFDRDVEDFPQLTWKVKHMRVPELSSPKRLLHLAQALQKKGYKPSVIEKILGGNYFQVFREVVG